MREAYPLVPLPYDYARCDNKECELRAICRRSTPGHPSRQWYASFIGGPQCSGFIGQKDASDA